MNKKPLLYKTLIVGIIVLFIGVGIQPAFADVSFESNNSELVEITVQFYEVDRTFNHTVLLTQEKVEELDIMINNFKSQLDSTDNPIETETIYKNAVASFDELGLLPDDMSVEYVQQLVIGKEQNPRIMRLLESYYNKNQKSIDNKTNFLCLISGESINTLLLGPFPLLFGLRGILSFVVYIEFLRWLKDNNPDIWSWWLSTFGRFDFGLFFLRMLLWIAFAEVLNFFPLKIGAFIRYGWFKIDDPEAGPESIPAEGWVNTYGLSGTKNWSGGFYGNAFGFTGIKITRDFLKHYYLGAVLKINMNGNPLI